ncbi:abscisate beta-glucosyltransferase-like [Cornus florida]|uniref:abscisate beta-glucosyltransferase-like n=1 Tax=Cornus florida TaxID=4283 RepID=UPI002899697D|nr:abscisate beta-glucosyltransferase-like [Cornus florida]
MEATGEIFVVPAFGQGHLFPCMELCKQLSTRSYKITLIMSSNLSSSIPSSLRLHPFIEIAEITDASSPPYPPPSMAAGPGPGTNPFHNRRLQMGEGIKAFLETRFPSPGFTRPVLAVLDVMESWSKEIFTQFNIPAVSFFTSGACAEAMEFAAWKAHVDDIQPGEIRMLPGLPEDMAMTYSDIKQHPHRPPHMGGKGGPPGPGGPAAQLPGPPGGMKFGPLRPGQRPMWVDEIEGSIALLINTCDDLERPFIDYVANQIGKPVWGVGPLLPKQYWSSAGSVLSDREIRPKRQSNYTEEEVIQWLDSKPRGSVIYVSFGSAVGPTLKEYDQLAEALEEWTGSFIWVIQPGSGKHGPPSAMLGDEPGSDATEKGYYPHGLEGKIGDRGLIIRGWAPQLMILSHPSTGGFLSHCGWNSTVEAIGRGVPFLAWPIRGDQFYDAKFVVNHLKVGYMVSTGDQMVNKETIMEGIKKLMTDEKVQRRAEALAGKFEGGFPASSAAALDAFWDFISQKAT